MMNEIIKAFDDVELPKLMMNWNDVRQLKNEGHYIGSHTVNHPMLGTMDNLELIEYELSFSAQVIQKELGYFPASISYPVGSYNQTTTELSKKVGYSIGLAVHQTIYDTEKNGLFEIPRIEIYNESWWKTYLRITNYLEEFKKLIRYKK
jgi:peptidoglycan/xylan/chitin deacetylase (PgdA/CDA1 family)